MRLLYNLAVPGFLICLFSLSACQQEENTAPPQNSGVVEANQSYQDNFGTPPQGKAGQAFARVGYLPLQKAPEKLRALPLFLFSEKEQLRQILDRLISGELLQRRESELYDPFPDDLEISVLNPEGPIPKLLLTTQQSWSSTDQAAAGRALAETTLQFALMDRVMILLNGTPLPQMPVEGYLREPQSLVMVEPPALVLLAGVWEEGSDALTEILVEFDRPVTVNNFKLYDKTDNVVDGEYFTSIFQMAVVLHPKDPRNYHEAMVLRAEWDVVDYLGRSNRGTDTLPMQRIDH